MWPTEDLLHSSLFRAPRVDVPLEERVVLAYRRARAMGKAYGLSFEDVRGPSEKFWTMHTDPIWAIDGAAGTLVTIQLNLCAGTISMFISNRPDLTGILQDLLSFNVTGQFCLTELAHGLDVFRLETTAELLPDGSFELNTPNDGAAKFMPPTAPVDGIPCVSVVFARTLVNGDDHGVKPFLVPLNNGHVMTPGIVCRLLPQRGGGHPVNHSLTYFHRVRIPYTALLCSIEKPQNPRLAFFEYIHRVAVGTVVIGSQGLPALQLASFIAAKYSNRRIVLDSNGKAQSILSFRTQKIPILTALAQSYVMQALYKTVTFVFTLPSTNYAIQHGIGSVLKVVMLRHALSALSELAERCGAQGLFEHNQISAMHDHLKGAAIAEGDCLVVSIRLATELLLGRYQMIPSSNPESLLSRHEVGIFNHNRQLLAGMPGHRSSDFDRLILPEAQFMVESLGHRIAYDAAIELGVEKCLVDLYEASCLKLDPAWYAENAGISRQQQKEMESTAIEAVFARMEEFLERTYVSPYAIAPIISQGRWDRFVNGLTTYGDVQLPKL